MLSPVPLGRLALEFEQSATLDVFPVRLHPAPPSSFLGIVLLNKEQHISLRLRRCFRGAQAGTGVKPASHLPSMKLWVLCHICLSNQLECHIVLKT